MSDIDAVYSAAGVLEENRIDNMAEHGWTGDLDPADIVIMHDGGYTTLDHRRVLAARATDNPLYAHVHHHSDPFEKSEVGERFPVHTREKQRPAC